MFPWLRYATAIVAVFVLAAPVYAQTDSSQPWEKFGVSLGGFVTQSDTTFQLNSKTLGAGAVVDLENVLGVEQTFRTGRLDANYRFGDSRRHEIEFHYFSSKREGNKTLDRDVQIGDVNFAQGTGVFTDFELRFANVDYVYNFLMDDRVRLGVSAGLHTTGVKLKVNEAAGPSVEEESFTAPLPMLGLRADVVLTPRWRLKTAINLFYIEYDRFTGKLADTYIGVEYLPWKNFGFGGGINAINYDVEADSDASVADWDGQLKFQLTGFMIYGKYFF